MVVVVVVVVVVVLVVVVVMVMMMMMMIIIIPNNKLISVKFVHMDVRRHSIRHSPDLGSGYVPQGAAQVGNEYTYYIRPYKEVQLQSELQHTGT